jgi:hypothetical protein
MSGAQWEDDESNGERVGSVSALNVRVERELEGGAFGG